MGVRSVKCFTAAIFFSSLWSSTINAIQLDVDDDDSIRTAAATAAWGLQSMYTGNRTGGTLGKFPYPPFYWWLSGAAWGGMVDYQHYTGDNSYFDVTYEALVSQISPTYNFLPIREKFDEGNDDIAFWAFGAMSAAEYDWPEPPSPYPSWFQVCDNVFNDYVERWNFASDTCGGGLKWQVFSSSAGYYYKNSISNGGFFQLAARLYRYTGNETYYDWAREVWNWSTALGFIVTIDNDANSYVVWDGADEKLNCSSFDHTRWSYNVAVYLYGTAVLSNFTGGDNMWTERTIGLVNGVNGFISPFDNATDIMYERACEPTWSCNVDQYSFKAYLARWLGQTRVIVPQLSGRITQILRASAAAAANACTGAGDGASCGARWYLGGDGQSGYDGVGGVGQQLSVLEVIYSLLVR